MLTIAISPQLHHAVKWTKIHTLIDVSSVVLSLSSLISPSESKAILNTFSESKDINNQEDISSGWG